MPNDYGDIKHCQKTHTESLKSKPSVIFTLYESLEHIAAALRLSRNLAENNEWEAKELEEQRAL